MRLSRFAAPKDFRCSYYLETLVLADPFRAVFVNPSIRCELLPRGPTESLEGSSRGLDLNTVIELSPKVVDGRDSLSGDSFSVDEHDAVDQLLQSLAPV